MIDLIFIDDDERFVDLLQYRFKGRARVHCSDPREPYQDGLELVGRYPGSYVFIDLYTRDVGGTPSQTGGLALIEVLVERKKTAPEQLRLCSNDLEEEVSEEVRKAVSRLYVKYVDKSHIVEEIESLLPVSAPPGADRRPAVREREQGRCRLLTSDEVDDAVRALPARSALKDDREGFRILVDEPELYNKWLYTIPDAGGRHRLVGLSRRFCPFTNRCYAGLSFYHPDFQAKLPPGQFAPLLKDAAKEIFERPWGSLRSGDVDVRGPVQNLTAIQYNDLVQWYDIKDWILWEWDVDRQQTTEERHRLRWANAHDPVWECGTGFQVWLAGVRDVESICQIQNLLNEERGLERDFRELRDGIDRILSYLERHRFLAIFTQGAFLVLRYRGELAGCVWCYRSFHAMRAGWTIWIRQMYILPAYRNRGGFRSLCRAALGLFAEAGYPTRMQFWLDQNRLNAAESALTRVGFRRSEDSSRYVMDIRPPRRRSERRE